MCFPQTLTQPITVDKVVMIVQRANAARGQVKVYGAGHSFSPCVLTDPISTSLRPDMLTGNLGKLAKVITLPTKSHPVVHVEAGIRIHDLNDQLHAAGFALYNAGAIAEQSVAGATQTSTHGTGRELGSMATQIVGLTMVLANGTVATATASRNTELFDAGRVGLGALGIMVAVELRMRPAFKLRRTTTSWELDRLIRALPGLNAKYDRLQWYRNPTREKATLHLVDTLEHADGERRGPVSI